jgi:hypothetical protein
MDDLIAALTILNIYCMDPHPTCCEHDVLYVLVDPANVLAQHVDQLKKLGFIADLREKHFYSYRFGSA